jgi:hypothetical protein
LKWSEEPKAAHVLEDSLHESDGGLGVLDELVLGLFDVKTGFRVSRLSQCFIPCLTDRVKGLTGLAPALRVRLLSDCIISHMVSPLSDTLAVATVNPGHHTNVPMTHCPRTLLQGELTLHVQNPAPAAPS